MKYKFECGCEFNQFGNDVKPEDGLPPIEIDFYNINHNCPLTWQLFESGKTKGVFQLDRGLGPHWSKQIKPTSIEEIAALVSLIRPGVLKAIVDKKSMTQHYADRKNGIEPITYIHKSIEKILEPTFGILTYQEQSMKIAEAIAGFTSQQADTLRKAIGKKQADLMNKVKVDFIEGCKKTGIVDETKAEEIFDNIEKSNRYAFNKCLSPTTLVETPNGFKSLEEIRVGDKVLAPSDELSQDIFVEVINKYDNGIQELFEITVKSDKTIQCTINHKFLCEDFIERPLWKILSNNHNIVCKKTFYNAQTEKIIDIKKIGKMKTLDLEVKSNKHLYYQNGLVGHNSHAVEYSEISFWTAYAKAHFPIHFYCAWLDLSDDKSANPNEGAELVEDAKSNGISVFTPSVTDEHFTMSKNGIRFGLKCVKGIGESSITKVLEHIRQSQEILGKEINKWNWFELLVFLAEKISKTIFNNLVSVGAFYHTGLSRQKMLHEYSMWEQLTEKEKRLIVENCSNLLEGVKYLIENNLVSSARTEKVESIIKVLTNPPYTTEDNPKWITETEEELLGVPLTITKVDNINVSAGNTTCKEFIDGKSEKEMSFGVEISRVSEYIVKSGKNIGKPMSFITLRDNTGSIEATIFTDLWIKVKNIIYKGNTCLINGYRSDRNGLIIKKVKEL